MNTQFSLQSSSSEKRLADTLIDKETLCRELQNFIDTLNWCSDDVRATPDGRYYYLVQMMPDTDLNREIVDATVHLSYPHGALCVRAYEGHWLMAVLPADYVGLGLIDIVRVLWPGYAEYVTLTSDTRQSAPSPSNSRLSD